MKIQIEESALDSMKVMAQRLQEECDTLRAQLAELQSGDELPELPFSKRYEESGIGKPFNLFTPNQMYDYARQAQAMARSKMLAELGKVEAVAWVRRHPDGSLTGEFLGYAVIESVRKKSGAWIPLYTRPLPAQDVNAELVRVLERIAESKLCPVGSPTLMVEQIQQLARTALANAKAAQQKE